MEQYVKILGLEVGGTYTASDLKQRWREQCKKHHPDRGGDPEKFKMVMHAYKMLTNPAYRDKVANEEQGKVVDLDITLQLPLRFEDVCFRRDFVVSYNRPELDANGKLLVNNDIEIVNITIQYNPDTNGRQVIPGAGKRMGDQCGDAIVNIGCQSHPTFKVVGADVVSEVRVPLHMMLKGVELDVTTAYGIKTIRIPLGAQPGEQIKIPKCGVGEKGYHIVVLQPVYPKKDDLKKNEWKGLGIDWTAEVRNGEDQQYEDLFEKLMGRRRIDVQSAFVGDTLEYFNGGYRK